MEELRITLRDVYDSVGDLSQKIDERLEAHEKTLTARFDKHEAEDDSRFEQLNFKVYGILGTVVAAALAVLINISGVHLT